MLVFRIWGFAVLGSGFQGGDSGFSSFILGVWGFAVGAVGFGVSRFRVSGLVF